MKFRAFCIAASTLLLAAAMASAQTATINFGTAEQTIRGFGGSTAWQGTLTTAQANALFSPSSGLGLSILRVRIDPTGTSANSWVPTDGSWLEEVTNAKEAVAANPNALVFATPWTPPASMKNTSTAQPYYSGTCSPAAGYCGGYLDPTNYAAYASYLESFVTYFNTNAGFDLYAISMQNEPDYANVDYESCNWTAAQMDTWIAGNASVLTPKLIMPESFQFIQAQALTALDDVNAEPRISIIGGHLYGASPAPYPLAVQDGKDVWMTEHALTPSGSAPTIADAIALAEEVHNSMVTGNYNAYVWWWVWNNPGDADIIGLIDSSTTSPAFTYYGYALGQFSKYIQPGYVMVNATNPIAGVYDSAYMGDGNLVIVAVNSNTSATSFPVSIAGQIATSFTPYQTSATETMTQLSPVSVSNEAFTYTLPAQSITTFVGTASTTPGFTLSSSASSLSLPQGKTATDTITVANLNGFAGSVTLAVSGLPTGVTAAFGTNPTTGTSVLTLTASSTATTGAATVTVTGTSGSLSETATISLFVGSSACAIVYTASQQSSSAFGATIDIYNTSSTALSSWTLGWTFLNGQTISSIWNDGTETQTGANVTVTNASFNGTIAAGGSMGQLGFNGTWNGITNQPPAFFTLNGVTCTNGAPSSTGGSFTLKPSATALSVAQGASGTDTITVTDVSPFTGSVTLAASGLPTGVTAAFATNPATSTSVLTLTASAAATAGTSTVTITGTSGTLTATTTISLTVTSGGSFTLLPSASTLSIAQSASGTDTITVTDVSPFTGSVTLAASGLPTGVTAAFATNPTTSTSVLTLTASATATTGAATVTITGTSGSLTATTTIALTVTAKPGFTLAPSASALSVTQAKTATDTITVTDVGGFTGSVTLVATGLPTGVTVAYGTNPTTSTSVLTFTASSTATVGTATVTITGTSGTTTATTTIALTVATGGSFTLSRSATTLSIAQSASGTDTITVTDVSPFTGSVTLAASGLPTGVTAAFATNPTTSTSVLTLTASATATTGAATVTITGTSGTLTATTTIALTVTAKPGFTLAPSASTLSVTQGASATDTITVTDVGGFTGSVTLAASGLPTGITVAYSTNPTTSTSVLTFTASSTATTGAATVTITGTSGTTTATTTITLTSSLPPGFSIKPSAATLSITQGKTATDTMTVTEVGGFTGSVTLAATGLPTGVTVAYGTNPTTSTSVLTFTASATATAGTSTVTFTGTSGTTISTTTIALTVVPSGGGCTVDYSISPQNSSAFGASLTLLNTGSTAWTSWTLTWSFANGQTVSSLWNGIETQSGVNVTVTNEPYNGSVAAGGSVSGVGFNGTWNGTTNAIPTAFSINGTACTVN